MDIIDTSIVCAIRNRNKTLEQSLATWLDFPVAEILLVDFRDDGCESIWDIVKNQNDKRIKGIETKYEYRWVLAIAYNLAIQQTSEKYCLKLDVDYILDKNFLDHNIPNEQTFIARKINRNTGGLIYFHKSMWQTINGYNENLLYWGYEEVDFRNRLLAASYTEKQWDVNSIYHIPHLHKASIDNQYAGENKLCSRQTKILLGRFNNQLAQCIPWTTESPRIQWNIEQLEAQRFLATRRFENDKS